jgi:hypothetical protein
MSNWAEIDENNFVVNVIVGDESMTEEFFVENLGGRWVSTLDFESNNGTVVGIGDTYDPINNMFILPVEQGLSNGL